MEIIKSVDKLYRIIHLKPLRQTPGVFFDQVPESVYQSASAVDRVIHQSSAVSPGCTEGGSCPWYMHPHQDDNLLVLYGTRHIDLYTPAHGKVETFIYTPDAIFHNGKPVTKDPAMLMWPRHVFHRVRSDKQGSASLNFAIHHDGFDISTNFNIYDVNTTTGHYRVIRQGHLDQF